MSCDKHICKSWIVSIIVAMQQSYAIWNVLIWRKRLPCERTCSVVGLADWATAAYQHRQLSVIIQRWQCSMIRCELVVFRHTRLHVILMETIKNHNMTMEWISWDSIICKIRIFILMTEIECSYFNSEIEWHFSNSSQVVQSVIWLAVAGHADFDY